MHHCVLWFSNGSCTPPHKSIGMQSIRPEVLESQILWDSTTEGLWTYKHLSHIITIPFLWAWKSFIKRCQIQRKATRHAVSPTGYLETLFLIKGPHHNVHKLLPVHLQWSVQSCKTAGILKALALSLLRFSVDHLWLTQLGRSTGWCLLLISVSHWLNHWMQYVNEVQSNLAEGWHRLLSSANETKGW